MTQIGAAAETAAALRRRPCQLVHAAGCSVSFVLLSLPVPLLQSRVPLSLAMSSAVVLPDDAWLAALDARLAELSRDWSQMAPLAAMLRQRFASRPHQLDLKSIKPMCYPTVEDL